MDILILLAAFLPERQGKTLNARKFGGCLRMELGMVCGMCVCVCVCVCAEGRRLGTSKRMRPIRDPPLLA